MGFAWVEALNESSVHKLALETQLADALDQDELQLHYQPRQDLASGRVVGMEALLRWRNPELGVVPPKDFIPVAEESGLIVPIGEWVVRTACAQNRAWQEAGYERVCVSVNVSPRQFAAADLVEVVTRALRDAHLDPRDLEIELTESVLLQDDESTATALRDLRAIGVKVALDDFGTGYSSLSYLSRFPLDTLKMDRCFVRDVHADPGAAGVAHAVIGMAHALGLRVVAEGVDSEDQAALLRQHGCDEVQGFLFSGAVCADDFVRFLSRQEGRR